MALNALQRSAGLLDRFHFPVRYPAAAIEIEARRVCAVRLKGERRGRRLAAWGTAGLPASVVLPTAASPRPGSAEDLRRAIEHAADEAGIRPGKASLLLPDSLARVWLLPLPELPRSHQGVLEMIRWKIKRTLPFRVEDGTIAWQVLSRPTGAEPAMVLASLIPRAIITHYESALAAAGLKIGLVDLASLNLYNFYRQEIATDGFADDDFAVLNAAESYFTLMLFQKGDLVFFRCKTHADGDGSAPEDRTRAFRRELATSLSYYSEKLKGQGIRKTYVRIGDAGLDGAGEILTSLEFGEIETIDASRVARLPAAMDPDDAARLIPAMGAAMGRGGGRT